MHFNVKLSKMDIILLENQNQKKSEINSEQMSSFYSKIGFQNLKATSLGILNRYLLKNFKKLSIALLFYQY